VSRSHPTPRQVPIEKLREAAAHAIETSSLRATARAIGLSPTGLQKFAEGASPYRDTRRKVVRWYLQRETAAPTAEPTADVAAAALEMLLGGLPARERLDLQRAFCDEVRAAYDRASIEPPDWVRDASGAAGGPGEGHVLDP
jgi:hypothetical protein